jgi:TonB family protein
MGKIVKYCNACEEGFAEKFAFCPNCGSGLTAFELNPVLPKVSENIPQTEKPEQIISVAKIENEVTTTKLEPTFTDSILTIDEPIIKAEEPVFVAPIIEKTIELPVNFNEKFEEPTISFNKNVEEIVTPIEPEKTVTISGFKPIFTQAETKEFTDDEYLGDESAPIHFRPVEESEYRPTFVEDKNRGSRMKLLLGSMALVFTVLAGSWVYSLFAKSLSVDSIDSEIFAYVTPPNDEPFLKEKEIIEKKNTDKGGGGGGGGKNEKNEASEGQMARQMEKPDLAPSARMDRVTNPTLTQRVGTEGKAKTDIDPNKNYGVKNGGTTISDGTGSGGGLGSGTGTGQGRGEGTGRGNGRGSGSGNGDGNGNGDGRGDGDNGDLPPVRKVPTPTPRPVATPEPKPVANTFRITSQPRANYSDAGRQNNVNGVVRLKVTFQANGQIGGISVVSGLPYGLTEQAIAAARNIKFIPGASTVSKTVEYRFTLY